MFTLILCIYTLLVRVSVCLFVSQINVKTAEPIGPNFFVGPRVTPGIGLWMIVLSKICLQQNSIFENI